MRRGNEIPTIDVALVTISPEGSDEELALDTANKIAVEPTIETTESVKLIIKNKLRAQKPEQNTLIGHQITLSDNVFIPELAVVLQGGVVTYDERNPSLAVGYKPPVVGSSDSGEKFVLNAYSTQYDEAGNIVRYEKISYPGCKGKPIALSAEDGVFRASEYVINSSPNDGEAPYEITYVDQLPIVE